jgi:Protein of unknown function (DUF5661)
MRSQKFTSEEAYQIGNNLFVDFGKYDLEEFRIGLFVELEDGMEDPTTDLTDTELQPTVQKVLAHLNEKPDHYTKKYHMFAESAKQKF